MALDADPYRTLGLSRGATLDEVKRAYRRLAKANHPDAAGEKALPRFLAIQAAYEQLIVGSAGTGKARRGSAPPRRPWEADPDRGDATRRAYGGRARNTPPGARGTPPGAGGASGTAGSAGSAGSTGATGGGARPGTGPTSGSGGAGQAGGTSSRSRRRASEPGPGDTGDDPRRGTKGRPPNKATLGSTSYDGADAGPFEPDWGGASWYGTTSGTYWTLNPKEYADPRKHGPEYQARARRAARARGATGDTAADPAAAAEGTAGHAGPRPDPSTEDTRGQAGQRRAAGPTHTTTSWWDSTAGAAGTADPGEGFTGADPRGPYGPRPRPSGARPAPASAEPPPPDLGRAAADITHALTDDRFGGLRGRVVRGVIGWLPIALGLGWLVGELTGCGRFAATCDVGAVDPLLLLLQVAVLAVLLLVPAIASVATMASLTLLAAAVVASLILSATGGAADGDSRRAALGIVLLIAWLTGLTIAIVRRARALRSRTSPVS